MQERRLLRVSFFFSLDVFFFFFLILYIYSSAMKLPRGIERRYLSFRLGRFFSFYSSIIGIFFDPCVLARDVLALVLPVLPSRSIFTEATKACNRYLKKIKIYVERMKRKTRLSANTALCLFHLRSATGG